jgi:hypothetical protein
MTPSQAVTALALGAASVVLQAWRLAVAILDRRDNRDAVRFTRNTHGNYRGEVKGTRWETLTTCSTRSC